MATTTAPVDFRLNQRELSDMLGVSTNTIVAWVRKGYIPKPQRVSHNTLYSLRAVLKGVEDNRLRINPPRPLPEM